MKLKTYRDCRRRHQCVNDRCCRRPNLSWCSGPTEPDNPVLTRRHQWSNNSVPVFWYSFKNWQITPASNKW